MTCMDALGVGHLEDRTLLKDKYARPNHAKFNLTSVEHCADDVPAAFHPHKSADRWLACHWTAYHHSLPPSEDSSSAPAPAAVPSSSDGPCAQVFKQCGGKVRGKAWTGPTCCEAGCTCDGDEGGFYSQCAPPHGLWTCNPADSHGLHHTVV